MNVICTLTDSKPPQSATPALTMINADQMSWKATCASSCELGEREWEKECWSSARSHMLNEANLRSKHHQQNWGHIEFPHTVHSLWPGLLLYCRGWTPTFSAMSTERADSSTYDQVVGHLLQVPRLVGQLVEVSVWTSRERRRKQGQLSQ